MSQFMKSQDVMVFHRTSFYTSVFLCHSAARILTYDIYAAGLAGFRSLKCLVLFVLFFEHLLLVKKGMTVAVAFNRPALPLPCCYTSSITTIGAPSPRRGPSFMIRV